MQIKIKKHLSVFIAFMFTVMAINPAIVFAENAEVSSSRNAELTRISKDKIATDVNKAFEQEDYVGVLVKLYKQVDTKKVSDNALNNLQKDATLYTQKIAKKYAVVDSLKSTAQISQKDLVSYLEEQKNIGNVEDFKSFYILNMVYVKASQEVVKEISQMAEVEAIQLDAKIEVEWPIISDNVLQTSSTDDDSIAWGVKKIEAPQVWNTFNIKGEGVVVGILDSGVAYQHEALKTKWRGYNAEDPENPNVEGNWFDAVDNSALPIDPGTVPHGTHVTGTICGQDPAGEHKIGVAPNAKFISARAFTDDGGQSSWIIACAEWMMAPGGNPAMAPDIINNSWSGGTGMNEWFREIVQNWRNAGILPVFAAGNMPPGQIAPPASIAVPANYPESFAVGATDINDQKPGFSRRGPGPYAGDLKPDVSAPGVAVMSSVPDGYDGTWNGTSMASPHVAGLAALLLSANASLTPDELEEIMMNTADPRTDSQVPEAPNFDYGHGRINAFNAVSSVVSGLSVVKGKVLKEGNDYNDPEIINVDELGKQYEGFNLPISIEVKDDIAISKVEMLVKPAVFPYWIQLPCNRTSGSHLEGIYTGTVPGELVKTPGLEYKFIVTDYGNNQVMTDVYSVEVAFGEKVDEYTEDFTSEPVTWTTIKNDWQWGEITVGPEYEEGNKVMGTNLYGKYSNSTVSELITPPLDLRNTANASLTVKHSLKLSDTYDKAEIYATNDFGATWVKLMEVDPTEGWENLYVDLTQFAGSEAPLFVDFVLDASMFGNDEGWYVDNLALHGEDTEAPAAPANLVGETIALGVKLSWDKNSEPDVHKYQIFKKTTEEDAEFAMLVEVEGNEYVDEATESGVQYVYKLKAVDFAGNISEESAEVTVSGPSITTIFERDFEADNGGFTTDGDVWQWGTPSYGATEAVSGEKVWGTVLDGKYPEDANAYVESPVIDLTNVSNAILSFKQWMDVEVRWDAVYMDVKAVDETEWTRVVDTDGGNKEWETFTVSLEDFVGKQVNVRFILESDGSMQYAGWYIDDFSVITTENETESYPKKVVRRTLDAEKEQERVEFVPTQKFQYNEKNTYSKYDENQIAAMRGLPANAVVTIIESGKSIKVNPSTGEYRMVHPSNEEGESYTMRVEAYGYNTVERTITLEKDQTIVEDFMLEAVPSGTVTGTILNERTNEPIVGAFVSVVNDGNITPAVTDDNGQYTLINVLEGEWTIKVTHSDYYENTATVEVAGDQETAQDITMKPYIGYTEEIAYDDGIDENATVLNSAGNGIAVMFTPKAMGLVKGVNVKFYGNEWPQPGGTEVKFAIYGTDTEGNPGDLLFITDVLTIVRGEWNYIDLSSFGFVTDKNFLISTVQIAAGTESAGVCTDTTTSKGRTYLNVGGNFELAEEKTGNALIRASVSYEVTAPVLDTPSNMTYTNQDTIAVTGSVDTLSNVKLYVNDEMVEEIEAVEAEFATEITLNEGNNEIYTVSVVEGKETDPSQKINVIKDTVNPVINITAPVNNVVINSEVVTVQGTVEDANIESVTVNGEAVEVNANGEFAKRIIVEKGENNIVVVATDKAGNNMSETVKVTVNNDMPSIEVITPVEDMVVNAGDVVEVTFRSDAHNGTAYFNIIATGLAQVNSEVNGIAMNEVEPGLYKGTWTVPEKIALDNATVRIHLTDQAGNVAEKTAPGRITSADNVENPVEILNVEVKNQFGGTVVEAEIRNMNRVTLSPTLIIVVTDEMNRVVNISSASISELMPGKTITLSSGFNTPEAGTYQVRALVWDSIEDMNSLAVPMDETFVIE